MLIDWHQVLYAHRLSVQYKFYTRYCTLIDCQYNTYSIPGTYAPRQCILHGWMTAEVGLISSHGLQCSLSSSLGMNEMWTGLRPVLVTTSRFV